MYLRCSCVTSLLLAFFFVPVTHADTAQERAVFGARPGYLFNVVDEKDRRELEMVMLEPPKEPPKKKAPVIVDEKLTKEFQEQYRNRFGETQAEQVIYTQGRDDEYTYNNQNNVTAQAYRDYQQQFGQYMFRRLAEYHVDKTFKEDPSLKPIYEAKDKYSNLNVETKQGYKFSWRYNISGTSLDFNFDNPYHVTVKIQYIMRGLIGSAKDIIFTTGYQINPRIRVDAFYKQAEQLMQGVVTRRMSKRLTLSLTASNGQVPGNPDINQTEGLVGFGYTL